MPIYCNNHDKIKHINITYQSLVQSIQNKNINSDIFKYQYLISFDISTKIILNGIKGAILYNVNQANNFFLF